MKKIITILLLFAVNLISQETEYWKKTNFDFDSGIKQISMYYPWEGYSLYSDISFFVLTESNDIYYFENIDSTGININFPDTLNIQKMMLTKISGNFYYVMADSMLYYYNQGKSSWEEYWLPDSVEKIIDFTDIPYEKGLTHRLAIVSDKGVPFFLAYAVIGWEQASFGLENEQIMKLQYCDYNVYALTDKNNILINRLSPLVWRNIINIESSIDVEKYSSYNGLEFCYIDKNQSLYLQSSHSGYSWLIDTLITSFTYFYQPHTLKGLPRYINIIAGTDGAGIHYMYRDSLVKVGAQFLGKKITSLETNSFSNPDLCLLGTDEGEVYWAYWERPTDVEYENAKQRICISPNPATDYIEIKNLTPPSPQAERDYELNIYDVLGQKVECELQKELAPHSPKESGSTTRGGWGCVIDVSLLQQGIYFVRVGNQFLKFVKM